MRLEKFENKLIPVEYVCDVQLGKMEKDIYTPEKILATDVRIQPPNSLSYIIQFKGNVLDKFQEWYNGLSSNNGKADSKDSIVIHVSMPIYHPEDAEVNGVEENEDSPRRPFLTKKDGVFYWNVSIDVENGKILDWPSKTTLKTWDKVVDELTVECNRKTYEDYVPDFLSIWDRGYGDYVYIEVLEDGTIKDWNSKKCVDWLKEQEFL